MNTLIRNRPITPADVLAERAVRAKVLFSPCQAHPDQIKWRHCACFFCRSYWDPTGEQDAALANAETNLSDAVEPEVIPTCLPPPEGSDKTVTISGSELLTAIRLLENYSSMLKQSINKIMDKHEEKVKTSESYPMLPPELDNLFCQCTIVKNCIQDLKRSSS